MKTHWRLILFAGMLLLAMVLIVTPLMLKQTITVEAVVTLETPLAVIAHVWCEWMILKRMWIPFTVSGAALTVGALVLRRKQRK